MRRKNERPYLRFKGQRRAQSTNQGTHHCTPMLLTITRTNPPVQLELMNKTYHKCARCGRRLNRANKRAQRLDALYKRQFHMINRAHDTTNQTTVKLRNRQLRINHMKLKRRLRYRNMQQSWHNPSGQQTQPRYVTEAQEHPTQLHEHMVRTLRETTIRIDLSSSRDLQPHISFTWIQTLINPKVLRLQCVTYP